MARGPYPLADGAHSQRYLGYPGWQSSRLTASIDLRLPEAPRSLLDWRFGRFRWRLTTANSSAGVATRDHPTAAGVAGVKNELRHKGVTLQLLWQEYLERHPGGYQYSQFCRLYHPIYDSETEAVVVEAQIFVSVLGASNYHPRPQGPHRHWTAPG